MSYYMRVSDAICDIEADTYGYLLPSGLKSEYRGLLELYDGVFCLRDVEVRITDHRYRMCVIRIPKPHVLFTSEESMALFKLSLP